MTLLFQKLGGLIKPGTLGAVAMICGFWASLVFAIFYVSGAAIGAESKFASLVCFGLFAAFFLLHSIGPWSKWAAVLGFCSFVIIAVFFKYLSSQYHLPSIPPILSIMVLAVALGSVGVLIDAGKYWKWLTKTRRNSLLNDYDYSI